MTQIIYVLTKEPYHDKSWILGVYDNVEEPLKVFLDPLPKNGEDMCIMSFDLNGEKRKELYHTERGLLIPTERGPWDLYEGEIEDFQW